MAKKCPKCKSDNPGTATFCADCGTQLLSFEDKEVTETIETPKEELTRGTTFANRYEIIEELGKGGMGRVYRVEDKKLELEVALKLIKPEIAKNKKTIDRFRNELKLARNIRHKNVCGMFDLGETKGAHFITMEYIRGEDLGSLIRRIGQLPVGKSISITKQICEGLAEAHRLGVVHRDLKSNNIMIDKDGNVRIMDFGIARSIEAKSITGAGMIIGTPEYMSPEQVEGEEVDQRSDIYSLGVILYEMLTGRVPFVGDTPFSIGIKHKSEVPQDPRELNTQIPNDLNKVILKCLEKNVEKRYQKVEQLFPDLAKWENLIPTTDKTIRKGRPKTHRERKKGWKKPLVYGFASFIILLIVAGGIFLLFPRKEAFNSIAVLPFAYEQDNPDLEYLGDGITESLINKLSQLPNLTVISRFSVFQYKGKDPNPHEVGTKLKVKAVLLGKIIDRSDGLSVVAELVNASDNSVIWGDQYNRKKLEDIFSIQENISAEITDKLRERLASQLAPGHWRDNKQFLSLVKGT